MTNSKHDIDDIIRRNLISFRQEVGLTQETAAAEAGVALNRIVRAEGSGQRIDASMLHRLAYCYGRKIEHFYMTSPPPPQLNARPALLLRLAEGVEVPPEIYEEVAAKVAEANRRIRELPPDITTIDAPKRPRRKR